MENLNSIGTFNLWGILEVFLVVLLFIYIFFAILVVRQIYLMNKALITGISSYIKLIGWAHLAFAFLVLFISVLILF
ncbi:MAG: DUF5657 family protein [bacterium]